MAKHGQSRQAWTGMRLGSSQPLVESRLDTMRSEFWYKQLKSCLFLDGLDDARYLDKWAAIPKSFCKADLILKDQCDSFKPSQTPLIYHCQSLLTMFSSCSIIIDCCQPLSSTVNKHSMSHLTMQ